MRITCPACGARYAIADGEIPAAGRSVQCSACDAVWLARPEPASRPTAAAEPAAPAQRSAPPSVGADPTRANATRAADTTAPLDATPTSMVASMEETAPEGRPGFGAFATGFAAAAIAAAVAVAVYTQRDVIVEAAPALAQPLAAYAAAVDAGRAKLVETLR